MKQARSAETSSDNMTHTMCKTQELRNKISSCYEFVF
jgi:hypothetical protein